MKIINLATKVRKLVNPVKNNITEKYSEMRYESSHREVKMNYSKDLNLRINIVVPTIDEKEVFGGVSTAMNIFKDLYEKLNCDARIISMNQYDKVSSSVPEIFSTNEDRYQIKSLDIEGSSLEIRNNDYFLVTYWTTAILAEKIIAFQKNHYKKSKNVLFYLIQDYEPGFYPWSTEYAESERTYRFDFDTVAIFNSKELAEFFRIKNYTFKDTLTFSPVLNNKLKKILVSKSSIETKRKKQILVYGRPQEHRNAYTLIKDALKHLDDLLDQEASDWQVISLGANHKNIKFKNGMEIISKGKVSIKEYGEIMLESYLGLSLMISPHPSYPPLEMSTFGVKTITNNFENKNMNYFNDNLFSLNKYDAITISKEMKKNIENYNNKNFGVLQLENEYVKNDLKNIDISAFIIDHLKQY